jgi:hypothetical protein
MPKEQKVTLDEVVEIMGGEVRKAVDKYFDFLQKTVSSYPLGDTELGGKAKDCAEKNITMARDYLHKLSRAKNLLEVVPIHTEFMQSQLGSQRSYSENLVVPPRLLSVEPRSPQKSVCPPAAFATEVSHPE